MWSRQPYDTNLQSPPQRSLQFCALRPPVVHNGEARMDFPAFSATVECHRISCSSTLVIIRQARGVLKSEVDITNQSTESPKKHRAQDFVPKTTVLPSCLPICSPYFIIHFKFYPKLSPNESAIVFVLFL